MCHNIKMIKIDATKVDISGKHHQICVQKIQKNDYFIFGLNKKTCGTAVSVLFVLPL
jgi:hypothetical protein